jgi:outer membrane protein TolC
MRTCLLAILVLTVVTEARAEPVRPTRQATHPAPEVAKSDLTDSDPSSGLTADAVGTRAAASSYSAEAADENLRAAAARVDAAWVTFLPRLGAVGRYTRASYFDPPAVPVGLPTGTSLVLTSAPPGTIGLPATSLSSVTPPTVSFGPVLNNYLLEASLGLPISDYFLRINEGYSAATSSRTAAQHDVEAAHAKADADGRIAFYTWLRAGAAAGVAAQALLDQRTHLTDASNQFALGRASRADVMRSEAAVGAAELQVERAKDYAALTEEQVRLAIRGKEGEKLVPGEDLDTSLPSIGDTVPHFTEEALANRPELKSLDANADALQHQAAAARAAALPSLSAFADAVYANPNPRVIPQTQTWIPTWDFGAQITWSPNDAATGVFSASDLASRALAVLAQRNVARDAVRLEVMQAFHAVREADQALDVSKRDLGSAQEAYRVVHDLFMNGRASATALTDAQTDLTRARLAAVNAKADARVARVRLDHALGRDTKPRVASE